MSTRRIMPMCHMRLPSPHVINSAWLLRTRDLSIPDTLQRHGRRRLVSSSSSDTTQINTAASQVGTEPASGGSGGAGTGAGSGAGTGSSISSSSLPISLDEPQDLPIRLNYPFDIKPAPNSGRASMAQTGSGRSESLPPLVPSSEAFNSSESVVQKLIERYAPPRFDTYDCVQRIERAGMTHGQAVAVMWAMKAKTDSSLNRARVYYASKALLDNDIYLYSAALSEMRSEFQLSRRNEASKMQVQIQKLGRELERLNEDLKELMLEMRTANDKALDARKTESRTEERDREIRIQEMNNKLSIVLGLMRVEIENTKWDYFSWVLAFPAVIVSIFLWTKGGQTIRQRHGQSAEKQREGQNGSQGEDGFVSLG